MPAPWSLSDLRTAIVEVYGIRGDGGSVIEPPMTPLAFERAWTAWVAANPNQQFAQVGADTALRLAQEIGPVTPDELISRYPLAVEWLERRDRINAEAVVEAMDRYTYGQESGYVPGPDVARLERVGGPLPQVSQEQRAAAWNAATAVPYSGPGGPGGQYTVVREANLPPAPTPPRAIVITPPRAVEGSPPYRVTPYYVPTPPISPQAPESPSYVRDALDTELRMLLEGVHPEQADLEPLAVYLRPYVPAYGYQALLDSLLYLVTSTPAGVM